MSNNVTMKDLQRVITALMPGPERFKGTVQRCDVEAALGENGMVYGSKDGCRDYPEPGDEVLRAIRKLLGEGEGQ